MSNLIFNPPQIQQICQLIGQMLSLSESQTLACLTSTQQNLQFCFPFACEQDFPVILDAISELGVDGSKVLLGCEIAAKKTKIKRLAKIKNIIAIASGKGGVGKSASAVNLAFALQAQGAKVGILDADIYGPSVPIMLGNPHAKPESEDNKHMIPLNCHGVVANSIGYLVPNEDAAVWRGPMASKALQQILNETLWPELDYLIVDMPPGTGDIQLTMAQQVPLTAAVVVTTPQDIALADATKGIAMFNKVSIPVLGVVENMSYYQCRKCGNKEFVFATGGGEKLAEQQHLALLAQLPLDIQIREHADNGQPLIIQQPNSELAQAYFLAAKKMSQQLAYNETLNSDDSIPIVEKH
ncbi:iron-sulfur cluster carrier protein ApbC [Aliiglaciecola sp. 3_MG-2023]|uniref:iron-sulfur cluster carrier protein ApbC n=1 Tax=Aliiglaciecola sp. 3_MG-2023 TaxID=3062644 RepID=UPI0026E19F3C|nr:iron-sulfur cluster carrier protein ApbC [Aliiglaciecola sp. 3_MG-2023]MDO6694798.1 iron-sulfur cluster carrier protein ApbC [Aliiglaciecola sp. 3_MG-2023]